MVTAQTSQNIWDGVFTNAQVVRGEEAYNARCASCHSKDLRGNSNSPSLLGMSFMFLWEGRSVGELYTKIRTEMPSDQPASLPTAMYRDILTYILQSNGYPTGAGELATEQARLDSLLITAKTSR